MEEEAVLREKVRQHLQERKLPALPSGTIRRAWGGRGIGIACPVCDLPVRADENELQMEFAHENDPPFFDIFHVHIPCFAAWELERNKGQSP